MQSRDIKGKEEKQGKLENEEESLKVVKVQH